MNGYSAIYFDSFGVKYITKEMEKLKRNKIFITNIYRIEAYGSIISGLSCVGVIDFIDFR